MFKLGKFTPLIAAVAAVCAVPAFAQASRTWVSGVGDDLNPCSRTAPCKTFSGAITKTAAGGEINCLDPGGFGAVTVTKSITIDCTGTMGGQLAASTTGVLINTASVKVILRGLSINGGPPTLPGTFGVRFLQGTSLVIEDTIIQNFVAAASGFGILFAPSTAAELHVSNSIITQNGAAATGGGVQVAPTGASGSARVILDHVRFLNNGNNAFRADTTGNTNVAGVNVTIDNSAISGSANGVVANTPVGTTTINVMLVNSSVTNNSGTGVLASGGTARIRVGNSSITGNATGVSFGGGAIVNTYGNNYLNGNTVADGLFTAPPIDPQ